MHHVIAATMGVILSQYPRPALAAQTACHIVIERRQSIGDDADERAMASTAGQGSKSPGTTGLADCLGQQAVRQMKVTSVK
jgi:hypothetical protein